MLPFQYLCDYSYFYLSFHICVEVARRDRYSASVLSDGKARPVNSSVTPDVSESTNWKRGREEMFAFDDVDCESSPRAQRSFSSSSSSSSYTEVDTSFDPEKVSRVFTDIKHCLKCDELNTMRPMFCCACRNEF